MEGKIDLWIINELTGRHMAIVAGLADKIEKVYEVQQDYMYMAFSKNTPDIVIDEWQYILEVLRVHGKVAQIFSKWIMFSYSDVPESSKKLSADEKELQELSRQIKKLDEKINLILKHLKIPLTPKKT